MDSRYSLRWNNYANKLTDAFGSLLLEQDLVDVTLSCEGRKIKAHKMLLSACSPYFRDVFKENPCQHPVIVFKNIQYIDLKAIVDFIYCGEVHVLQGQLESFLSTASILEVKGLTDQDDESEVEKTMVDEDKMELVSEQHSKVAKKPVSRPSSSSGRSSPVAKKIKTSVEKLPDEPIEEVSVKKEVEEEEDVAGENDNEPEVSDPLETEPTEPNASTQGSDFETSMDDDFTSDVLNKLNLVLLSVKRMNKKLLILWKEKSQNEEDLDTAPNPLEDVFPLKSMEDIERFEINCQNDPKYIEKCVAMLRTLGGYNMKDVTLRILKRTIANSLAEQYSLLGRNKNCFKAVTFYKVILLTVKHHVKDVTEKEFDQVVARWLVQAKLRRTRIEKSSGVPIPTDPEANEDELSNGDESLFNVKAKQLYYDE